MPLSTRTPPAALPLLQSMLSEAVNQPSFPSEILRPGEEFHQQTVWRFFTQPPAPAVAAKLRSAASGGARSATTAGAVLACILAAAAASLW